MDDVKYSNLIKYMKTACIPLQNRKKPLSSAEAFFNFKASAEERGKKQYSVGFAQKFEFYAKFAKCGTGNRMLCFVLTYKPDVIVQQRKHTSNIAVIKLN